MGTKRRREGRMTKKCLESEDTNVIDKVVEVGELG